MTPYAIAKRELKGYFCTPIAYVFLIAFLVMAAAATFLVGDFFTFNEASLRTFFFWLPWLYLLLVPAAGMRLWSEERRQGTSELLLTLPVTPAQAVTGKFLAGWLFLTFGLLLTFPLPITVAILGDPDVGAMATGYIGAFLLAGAFLAICSLTSACTKNQVVSFSSYWQDTLRQHSSSQSGDSIRRSPQRLLNSVQSFTRKTSNAASSRQMTWLTTHCSFSRH
jgi:ABC-2 type transport system permease protein